MFLGRGSGGPPIQRYVPHYVVLLMCTLPKSAIVVRVMVEPTEKGRRKKFTSDGKSEATHRGLRERGGSAL